MHHSPQPQPPPLLLDAATAGDRHVLHRVPPAHVLMAIADGSGTPEGVELGCRRALATLVSTYRELPTGTTLTQRVIRAARNASFATYELAIVLPPLCDVAITLTAVAVAGNQMTAAHVGDGRVYLRRDGGLTQLSKDHTTAAEPEAEAERAGGTASHDASRGDGLTRALGRELLVAIDVFEMELAPDDAVVLCTDGIHRALPDDVIRAELARPSAVDACHALVARARQAGATDGLSVAMVSVLVPAAGPGGRP